MHLDGQKPNPEKQGRVASRQVSSTTRYCAVYRIFVATGYVHISVVSLLEDETIQIHVDSRLEVQWCWTVGHHSC